MFKHILVPTDGSNLSHTAAQNAVEIAKATGAHITAFHVAPAYKFDLHDDHVPHGYMLPVDYEEQMAQTAQQHLDDVMKLAMGAGVECDGKYALSDYPAAAIVRAVEKYGCDAIVGDATDWSRAVDGLGADGVVDATGVSEPMAPYTRRAATAAPEPLEDPPVIWAGFHGLRQWPKYSLWPVGDAANSDMLSPPR